MNELSAASKQNLLGWYAARKRDLPWRRSRDPYAIWVSEIMLQQTQVATVIPYFEKWMARFPTPQSLAVASEDQILASWQGLGYYRRARLLQAGAQYVSAHGFPGTRAADWIKVPGVGPYTAGAIASIAFGSPDALVDGNVIRVYARLNADSSPLKAAEANAWQWAKVNLETESAGDWNQALMELGATVCTSKSPQCPQCPLQSQCLAFREGDPTRYPSPKPSQKTVDLHQIILIPRRQDLFGIRRIPGGEWWENMWEFPRFDPDKAPQNVRENDRFRYLGIVKHTVTHHKIRLTVYEADELKETSDLTWITGLELEEYAMPSPQRKALKLLREAVPRLL